MEEKRDLSVAGRIQRVRYEMKQIMAEAADVLDDIEERCKCGDCKEKLQNKEKANGRSS